MLDLFYSEDDGVVDSLSYIILDSATKHLKDSELIVTQPNNNFSGWKFLFKIDFGNPNVSYGQFQNQQYMSW